MRTTDCPNCGNIIANPSTGCSCGFSLFDGVEVPPPAIVRETAHQHDDEDAPKRGAAPGAGEDSDESWPFDDVLASVDERLTPEPPPAGAARATAGAGASASRRTALPPRAQRAAPSSFSPAPAPRTAPSPATGRATALRPREAMLMGCPSCGVRISRRAPLCPKCGASPYAPCQICASRILSTSVGCPECGDPTPFQV